VRRKSVSVVRCVQVIFFMAFKFVTFFSSKYLKIDYEEADFLLG
jgi:ACR3 family arsenite efflux pump ArsB